MSQQVPSEFSSAAGSSPLWYNVMLPYNEQHSRLPFSTASGAPESRHATEMTVRRAMNKRFPRGANKFLSPASRSAPCSFATARIGMRNRLRQVRVPDSPARDPYRRYALVAEGARAAIMFTGHRQPTFSLQLS